MSARQEIPTGAPVWTDLMTSDVERSKQFYGALLGWEAVDPDPRFGGYFNFTKDGALVAGCLPAMPGVPVSDVWSVYLRTEDAQRTVDAAGAHGGGVISPAMPVADLGTMAVLTDAGGAAIGCWQPGLHRGFETTTKPGTPAWFELHTRDFRESIRFYEDVFGWTTNAESDTPEFRYSTLTIDGEHYAGVMDASGYLPDGVPAHWSVYFAVEDTDRALARTTELGGAVVMPAESTPYGRLAVASDATGAIFRLVAQEEHAEGDR